jgi:hypothetical protein
MQWWVLRDGSYTDSTLLHVACPQTLDLVWLSTTKVDLYLTDDSGDDYTVSITREVCEGMELVMAAAWEGKGTMRPRPTAVDRIAPLPTMVAPTRI